MYCPKCGKQIPDESNFCLGCGSDLRGTKTPEKEIESTPDPKPEDDFSSLQGIPVMQEETAEKSERPKPSGDTRRRAEGGDDKERPLWEGGYSGKALASWYIVYGIAAILAIVFNRSLLPNPTMTTNLIFWGAILAPLGILMFLEWVRKVGTRYKLTSHRILVRRGVLSRKVEEIQLVKVDDVEAEQSFLQRIFRVGVVRVLSTDATMPRLEIKGIDNPMGLMETIRAQVDRRRKRTITIDSV